MKKFQGPLDQLKAAVAACELDGEWFENTENRFHSFHAESGEVLNWWPSTETVQFQGKRQKEFKALFSSSCGAQSPVGASSAAKAFVSYGLDRETWDEIEQVLLRHGLPPIENCDGILLLARANQRDLRYGRCYFTNLP